MKQLKTLIVEDYENDALLLELELQRAGYEPACERVETAAAMSAALQRQAWDLVVADYLLPHFNGLDALALVKEKGLDLPFIVVSGNITDDTAVAAMKAGAHDYVMKSNLSRLGPAVERESARGRNAARAAALRRAAQTGAPLPPGNRRRHPGRHRHRGPGRPPDPRQSRLLRHGRLDRSRTGRRPPALCVLAPRPERGHQRRLGQGCHRATGAGPRPGIALSPPQRRTPGSAPPGHPPARQLGPNHRLGQRRFRHHRAEAGRDPPGGRARHHPHSGPQPVPRGRRPGNRADAPRGIGGRRRGALGRRTPSSANPFGRPAWPRAPRAPRSWLSWNKTAA